MIQFDRTEKLIGTAALQKLANSHVAVFGLGGVGSYTAEALARSGIGSLTLVDGDVISLTNVNRQLYALHSTLNQPKVHVAKARILDINPAAQVQAYQVFFDKTTADSFDFSQFDYVVDAIDTVTYKLLLAEICNATGTRLISCMGTGNKLDPTGFCVADIFDTKVCPLAKVMRKELKARGISRLKVVYSQEIPQQVLPPQDTTRHTKQVPASISFVPPVAGFVLAGEVIKDLIKE